MHYGSIMCLWIIIDSLGTCLPWPLLGYAMPCHVNSGLQNSFLYKLFSIVYNHKFDSWSLYETCFLIQAPYTICDCTNLLFRINWLLTTCFYQIR
jgi:TRAP-type mannitol/chloroaromatic compound transport system permease small subunit